MPRLRPMTAIYLIRGEQVLMLYRIGSRVVEPSWTGAAGGHMEQEEIADPKACVLRELREETGLTEDSLENLRLRYVTMRLKNGEIRENYYYFAVLKTGYEPHDSCEGRLQWHALKAVEDLPQPVTAKHVMRHYVEIGRFDARLYGGVTQADGMHFTAMEDF